MASMMMQAQVVRFKVSGEVAPDVQKVYYFENGSQNKVDSVVVTDGRLNLDLSKERNTFITLYTRPDLAMAFVNDGSTVNFVKGEPDVTSLSRLNKKLVEYQNEIMTLNAGLESTYNKMVELSKTMTGNVTPLQKAQGPGVCKLPKPPASRALCQAKRAPRAAFPSSCLAAQTKRWAEGLRVPAPLAGRGSTTARGILRLCPASASQTGLPWSSPPA